MTDNPKDWPSHNDPTLETGFKLAKLAELNSLIETAQLKVDEQAKEFTRLTTIGPVTMNMENEIIKAKNELERSQTYLESLLLSKKELGKEIREGGPSKGPEGRRLN